MSLVHVAQNIVSMCVLLCCLNKTDFLLILFSVSSLSCYDCRHHDRDRDEDCRDGNDKVEQISECKFCVKEFGKVVDQNG